MSFLIGPVYIKYIDEEGYIKARVKMLGWNTDLQLSKMIRIYWPIVKSKHLKNLMSSECDCIKLFVIQISFLT